MIDKTKTKPTDDKEKKQPLAGEIDSAPDIDEEAGEEASRKRKQPKKIKKRLPPRESEFVEKVVAVNRVSKTVTGGKTFSFAALVVVGDAKGKIGYSIGKAREVQGAIQKGLNHAKSRMFKVPTKGGTIPHETYVTFGAAKVLLKPAAEGTGIIAGASVRAVCECAGITDILTKSLGSQTPINVVQATIKGLREMIHAEVVNSN